MEMMWEWAGAREGTKVWEGRRERSVSAATGWLVGRTDTDWHLSSTETKLKRALLLFVYHSSHLLSCAPFPELPAPALQRPCLTFSASMDAAVLLFKPTPQITHHKPQTHGNWHVKMNARQLPRECPMSGSRAKVCCTIIRLLRPILYRLSHGCIHYHLECQ